MEKVIFDDVVLMSDTDIKNFVQLIGMNKLEAELSNEKHKKYKITISEQARKK